MTRALGRQAATRRPARTPGRDSGMSLVEVLVATAVFSVLISLVGALVIGMLRNVQGITARVSGVDQLRVATDAVTKTLRTAIRVEQLDPACTPPAAPADKACAWLVQGGALSATQVSVLANLGRTVANSTGQQVPAPTLITYRVEEDLPARPGTARLVEERRAPALPAPLSSVPACGCAPRFLTTGLQWPVPVESPVFDYADTVAPEFDDAGNRLPADATTVDQITVDLTVAGGRDNPDVSATSTVFLPNSVLGR